MTGVWGGVVVGMLAVGLLLVAAGLLVRRRPSLESRVLPYVRDVPTVATRWRPPRARAPDTNPLRAFGQPLVDALADRIGRLLGGRDAIQRRLLRAGSSLSVEAFRGQQARWGLAGSAAALGLGLLGPARGAGGATSWLVVSLGAGLVGVLARDQRLTRQVSRHESQILAEFPLVADLLAISVAAGEGPVSSLERIVGTCRGALPDEVAKVLAETRTGVPVTVALDGLASRSGLAIVARFAEGVAVAIERGTPLADVLTAQAGDVREASKRALLETGARKEVAMMIPVVFLIMPVTLLFAFYPGVIGLELLAP
jgi:tight adherence protein C